MVLTTVLFPGARVPVMVGLSFSPFQGQAKSCYDLLCSALVRTLLDAISDSPGALVERF